MLSVLKTSHNWRAGCSRGVEQPFAIDVSEAPGKGTRHACALKLNASKNTAIIAARISLNRYGSFSMEESLRHLDFMSQGSLCYFMIRSADAKPSITIMAKTYITEE